MAAQKKKKPMPLPPHIDGDFDLLSCDLSLKSPGYALIHYDAQSKTPTLIRCGRTANKIGFKSNPVGYNLLRIAADIESYLLDPDIKIVVREASFTRFNHETAIINMVNGVCELSAWRIHKLPCYTIAPITVKKAVGGTTGASKEDVAKGVEMYFQEHEPFETDDVSDAIAVGITCLLQGGYIDDIRSENAQ